MPAWNGARFSWSQHQSTLALQKFNQFFPLWTWSQFLVLGHLMSRVSWALSVTGSEVTQMATESLSGRSGSIRGKSEQRVVMADWLKRGRGAWGRARWNRNEDGERAHPHTQEREVTHTEGQGCFRRGNGATRRELGCGYRESESPGPLLVGGLSGLPSLSLVSASVKWEENIEHTVIQILLNVFNCPIEA